MIAEWMKHEDSQEMPAELCGKPFEAKFRNGLTARYPAHAKARWTSSNYPYDIVAYRITN